MGSHLRAETVLGVPNHATTRQTLAWRNRLRSLSRLGNRFEICARLVWQAIPDEQKNQGREMNPCPELNTPKMADRSGDQFLAKQPQRGQRGPEEHHSRAAVRNSSTLRVGKRKLKVCAWSPTGIADGEGP